MFGSSVHTDALRSALAQSLDDVCSLAVRAVGGAAGADGNLAPAAGVAYDGPCRLTTVARAVDAGTPMGPDVEADATVRLPAVGVAPGRLPASTAAAFEHGVDALSGTVTSGGLVRPIRVSRVSIGRIGVVLSVVFTGPAEVAA